MVQHPRGNHEEWCKEEPWPSSFHHSKREKTSGTVRQCFSALAYEAALQL